jgi:hypothetical protein
VALPGVNAAAVTVPFIVTVGAAGGGVGGEEPLLLPPQAARMAETAANTEVPCTTRDVFCKLCLRDFAMLIPLDLNRIK